MLNVVLYQPEIPPNTGNIIRLCSNSGCRLHLIRPLGFNLEDRNLRRAGLDYHEYSELVVHDNWLNFLEKCQPTRLFAFSTRGTALYSGQRYEAGDYLLFGPETRGLPQELLAAPEMTAVLKLPMRPQSRSLNLSNTVAVVVYEAWRQAEFTGAANLPDQGA